MSDNCANATRQRADSNLVILSLPYSFLVDSKKWEYESKSGLWQGQFEWSKALVPYSILCHHQLDKTRIIDNIGSLRDTVRALNYNGMSVANHIKLIEPQLNNQLITVSINGNETFINSCRSKILRTYEHISYKKIRLKDSSYRAIDANFILTLSCLALRYAVEIVVGQCDTDFKRSTTSSKSHYVYILGNVDRLSFAEVDVRVLIDSLLDGCFVDRITVPLSVVPTLGGVNMSNFTELTHESNVNLYLPYLLPSLKELAALKNNDDMSIWVSSKQVSEIILSKKILCNLCDAIEPRHNVDARIYVQEVRVSKEKLDLLSLYHRPELLAIMFKHGTFIQVPDLGQLQNDVVVVQGSTLTSLQETLSEFGALCSKLYTLELSFLRLAGFPADLEYFLINLVNLKRSCVLTFNEYGLRFVGGKFDIITLLGELASDINRNSLFAQLIQGTDFHALVSIELANDQKDFVSGKKNGKIVKILSQVVQIPSIKFDALSSLNFIIRLSVYHSSKQHDTAAFRLNVLAQTIKLLEMELPAEIKFNIPEAFHKSIIGNGGKVIQSIMKKYNVFIKFISFAPGSKKNGLVVSRDKSRNLYSFYRGENVIIKCPMKNLKNIEYAKYEIDQMVKQCCQQNIMTSHGTSVIYNTVRFELLRNHYQLLIRNNNYDLGFIRDLERAHATYIAFPQSIEKFKNESSFVVIIKGNDSKARLCAQNLQALLPATKMFVVEYRPAIFEPAFDENNPKFRCEVVIPFRLLLDSELAVRTKSDASPGKQAVRVITLSCYSQPNLQEASVQLKYYLEQNGLNLLEERVIDFNAVLSIEESMSLGRNSKSVYKSNSPERNTPKFTPRIPSHFNSSSSFDTLDLTLVPFSAAFKELKRSEARERNFAPLKQITNQQVSSTGGGKTLLFKQQHGWKASNTQQI